MTELVTDRKFVFWMLRGSHRQLINVPCQQPLAERQTCIHLNRRFGRAEAFTIEPRPIEAANASLPGSEHRAGIFDSARSRLFLLGGGDPVDPISARIGRDVRP